MVVKSFFLSSLAKVFLDEEPVQYEKIKNISMLKNEKISFQFVYSSDEFSGNTFLKIESNIKNITAYYVKSVPSRKPVSDYSDNYYLRKTPGLYPDLLIPNDDIPFKICGNQWYSIWIEVEGNSDISSDNITVSLVNETGETLCQNTIKINVIEKNLPEQSLLCTNWFHCDSLATYYGVEVFSDKFWKITENFIKTASAHGINFLLTPLFTPPLDTEIGAERLTVQLVDVFVNDGKYSFGFDKFEKWVDICLKNGIKYFEMSHLFTQWGAEHAPKIIANVDGKIKKIFGWDTVSTGKEYKTFLREFAKAITEETEKIGITKYCKFHISDEPNENHLETYSELSRFIHEILGEKFDIIDALSDYSFYEKGLVSLPVPCVNSVDNFYKKVPELWTYYCCGPTDGYYTNRFIAMPGQRTRILGFLLYKYNVKGFLQWGYNFYFSQLSRKAINPFLDTDANASFPSGDPFVVYPAPDGTAYPSIRLKIFYDAFQDMRALQLLEELTDKEYVLNIIENNCGEKINLSFNNYPRSEKWHIEKREEINNEILKRL